MRQAVERGVGAVARDGVVELPQSGTYIYFERRFRHALRFEVQLVEEAVAIERSPLVHAGGGASLEERHAQSGHRRHAVRVERGRVPADGCAPVVPEENRLVFSHCVD